MRPRKYDNDLPKCVYQRKDTFFFVKNGKWINIGKDKDAALNAARKFDALIFPAAKNDNYKDEIREYAVKLVARCRANAKGRRGIEFNLCPADIVAMLEFSNWRCAVTNTAFSLELVGRQRPYAPSIDRIDSSLGYTTQNCRVVCVAANYAMNQWGEKVLTVLAFNLTNNRQVRQPAKKIN